MIAKQSVLIRFVLLSLAATAVVGCGDAEPLAGKPRVTNEAQVSKQKAVANKVDVSIEQTSIADSTTKLPAVEVAIEEGTVADTSRESMAEPQAPVGPIEQPNPLPTIDPPPFRLLLPTSEGPLLVDVEILIDDVPLATSYEDRIRQILVDADDNEDDSTSWKEFLDYIDSDVQQFGRNVAGDRGQRRNTIKLQDRNRNAKVDFSEAVNVLFRQSGFDGPFRLKGTDYYRGRHGDSRVFAAIDQDQSQGLSELEIAGATQALFRLDQNLDQKIDLLEIMPVVSDNDDPAWKKRRSNRHGTVAMDLNGYVDWTMMAYSLDAQRKRRPFQLSENPIDQLDQNADGTIDLAETKEIRLCEPDLIVTANVSGNPGEKERLSIRWIRSDLQSLVQVSEFPSLFSIADQRFQLCMSLQDRSDGGNRVPAQAFAVLDANNDGELDEAEIPEPLQEQYPLKDFDADKNGKLSLEEINNSVLGKPPMWSVQLRGRAAEFPDALFAFLDSNHDLVLSTRECTEATRRLNSIRADAAELSAELVPSSYNVQIVRGDPAQQGRLFRFTPPVKDSDPPYPSPRWASRMDANLDGEISQLEFVGTAKQFRKLDVDEDGFVDQSEARSFGNLP
ncbi:hypothetical protein [Planctomycetes bacterium K23_9]|uniref:EF hand n=1 Tax=Stieleria marina TaxID=1930275 RepID=A0A517NMR8_9BACT|nr:EF hand [Planctomycetes bacterium K23_9]